MNITYYFGAGASCGALPMVKDLPSQLSAMAKNLHGLWPTRDVALVQRIDSIVSSEQFQQFADSLLWLADACLRHASVDTFAKKLFVRGELSQLNRLKAVLTCFFLIRQAVGPIDARYDSFFASLVSRKVSNILLPDSVKVISWNYDLQFEYAFLDYCHGEQQVRDLLQSDPLTSTLDPSKFCLLRLNGVAGLHRNERNEIARYLKWLPRESDLETIIGAYQQYSSNPEQFTPLLNFSWEENVYTQLYTPNAVTISGATDCLVAIGYSFPFFNRDVDRQIIGNMARLSKVYLQAPTEALPTVKARFSAIRDAGIEIILISDIAQFYLPREL